MASSPWRKAAQRACTAWQHGQTGSTGAVTSRISRSAGRITLPNMPSTPGSLQAFLTSTHLCIAMELVEGGTLFNFVLGPAARERPPLSVADARWCARGLGSGCVEWSALPTAAQQPSLCGLPSSSACVVTAACLPACLPHVSCIAGCSRCSSLASTSCTGEGGEPSTDTAQHSAVQHSRDPTHATHHHSPQPAHCCPCHAPLHVLQ